MMATFAGLSSLTMRWLSCCGLALSSGFGIVFCGRVENRPDARDPSWPARAVGIGLGVSVLFEEVYGALSFELCCDVDGRPAEERAAAACDEESDDVACSAHGATSPKRANGMWCR
jgi:hypothetical protein